MDFLVGLSGYFLSDESGVPRQRAKEHKNLIGG